MSYVIRTHNPVVTEETCAMFDYQVETTWKGLARMDPRELQLSDAIAAHLPTKKGGMGFTRTAWIRKSAYEASRAAAGIGAAPPQKQAVERTNIDLLNALPDLKQQLMHVNAAGKGLSTWFTDPSTEMAPKTMAAAMRLRLGTTHPALHDWEPCPGCSKSLAPREWTQHVVGCTRLRGINASTRHSAVKDALKKAIVEHSSHGTGVALHEPRWAKDTKCPGCHQEMKLFDWKGHSIACRALKEHERSIVPHASGPDIEIVTNGETILVDVTVVNPLNPSANGRSAKALAKEVTTRKQRKYRSMAEEEGCELVVAAVSAQGELSADFERLLLRVVPDGFFEARRAITAAAVSGTARGLLTAERQALGNKHAEEDEEAVVEMKRRNNRSSAHFLLPPDEWPTLQASEGEVGRTTVVNGGQAARNIRVPAASAIDDEWYE